MLYSRATIENDKIVILESCEVDQSSLTSDCWLVQLAGLTACDKCDMRDGPECGGGQTLQNLLDNEKEDNNGSMS